MNETYEEFRLRILTQSLLTISPGETAENIKDILDYMQNVTMSNKNKPLGEPLDTPILANIDN